MLIGQEMGGGALSRVTSKLTRRLRVLEVVFSRRRSVITSDLHDTGVSVLQLRPQNTLE